VLAIVLVLAGLVQLQYSQQLVPLAVEVADRILADMQLPVDQVVVLMDTPPVKVPGILPLPPHLKEIMAGLAEDMEAVVVVGLLPLEQMDPLQLGALVEPVLHLL
jgi:hypothetical protein